jgi:hypothetical protein
MDGIRDIRELRLDGRDDGTRLITARTDMECRDAQTEPAARRCFLNFPILITLEGQLLSIPYLRSSTRLCYGMESL